LKTLLYNVSLEKIKFLTTNNINMEFLIGY
jgi:hypothetical protein